MTNEQWRHVRIAAVEEQREATYVKWMSKYDGVLDASKPTARELLALNVIKTDGAAALELREPECVR